MSTSHSTNPLNKLAHTILSYDTNANIMLAAIVSLLVAILFILFLHIYAKWFLSRARQRSSSVMVPQVLGGVATSFHHFHRYSFAVDATTKGLEPAAISSIPIFVHKLTQEQEQEQEPRRRQFIECAICLSVFQDEEIGRRLPRCGHAFHAECIDMWFHSHSTCPICRSCPVVTDDDHDGIVALVEDRQITETTFSPQNGLNESETARMLEITIEVPNAGGAADHQKCSSPPSVDDSIKRTMSRNRSERKVHPSEEDPVQNQTTSY